MTAQNTLELAKQGDPAAIAVILTYHLSQRFNTSASAIRLGNYLSVLIDTSYPADQERLVHLVLSILRDLRIEGLTEVEVSARQIGDLKVQWSQTIELSDSPTPTVMMSEPTNSDLVTHNPIPETATLEPISASSPASTADAEWNASLKTLFQRPEIVILVAFAIMLVLWDSYKEWMEEVEPNQPLSGVRLARRLGVSTSTLSRVKERTNFSQWSQDLDPEGIAWSYENKVFVPRLN